MVLHRGLDGHHDRVEPGPGHVDLHVGPDQARAERGPRVRPRGLDDDDLVRAVRVPLLALRVLVVVRKANANAVRALELGQRRADLDDLRAEPGARDVDLNL